MRLAPESFFRSGADVMASSQCMSRAFNVARTASNIWPPVVDTVHAESFVRCPATMKSQSLLTRQLFRAITASRPYRIPGCPLQPLAHQHRRHARSFTTSQRRRIFGLSLGPTLQTLAGAKPTPANNEAALTRLVDLLNAKRKQSRPPSDEQVIDAFRFLFSTRGDGAQSLTRTEAYLANESLKYLRSKDRVLNDAHAASLTTRDLQNVLFALAAPAAREAFRSDYQALAAAVFDLLRQHPEPSPLLSAETSNAEEGLPNQFFESYITVLARTGSALQAMAMLREAEHAARSQSGSLWVTLLKGLVHEGRMAEFWAAIDELKQRTGWLDEHDHEDLCIFLAERDDVEAAIGVFKTDFADDIVPTTECEAAVLASAVRNNQAELAGDIASKLQIESMESDLGDNVGALLVYYATTNPSVANIRYMISELTKTDATAINMAAMNTLIRYAYSRHDSALAQQYIEMARSLGLRPDASTWLPRLDLELTRNDMDSAAEAFDALSLEDIPKDRSDVPILNRYISVLSCQEKPNHEYVMRIVDSILETGAALEPETVAGLCRIFLRRDDLDEASGLLRYRIDTFPGADRARVGAVFGDFILDPKAQDQRAWNAYDLLRHALPETPVEHRIGIMQSFFDRNRPDLACLVFGHMRQREELAARPTAEAYAQCYTGIAKCRDLDGLQMVYNMLKMDIYVDPNTKIHNALMQAYTACRSPFTSIIDHFWHILESREGPTLSSFALALQACETWIPQGSQEARRIMALMQSWNLVITKEIYDCYIGALAGQSEFENTVQLFEHMEDDTGLPPDAITLGTFYNAMPYQFRKDAVEKWAKEAYPALWEELLSFGDEIDEEWEIRYFKIDRTVDMSDDLLFATGEYSPQLARDATLQIEEPRIAARA